MKTIVGGDDDDGDDATMFATWIDAIDVFDVDGTRGGGTRARARRLLAAEATRAAKTRRRREESCRRPRRVEASGRYEAYEGDGWEHLTTTGETMDEWEGRGRGGASGRGGGTATRAGEEWGSTGTRLDDEMREVMMVASSAVMMEGRRVASRRKEGGRRRRRGGSTTCTGEVEDAETAVWESADEEDQGIG